MIAKIQPDPDRIRAFCEKWGVTELALFGSVLRDDFRPGSDVDVLIDFADRFWPSYWEWPEMMDELKSIFGRDIDLVPKSGLRNPVRRDEILRTAQVLHAAQEA